MVQSRIRHFFQQHAPLLVDSVPLVVGVSGGPDSLVLLHALTQVVDGRQLVVVHVDHQLRADSAEDANFVRQLCADWGVQCEVVSADVAAHAKANAQTIEEAARHTRYAAFAQVAQSLNAPVIVAHHQDDQAETVLMKLMRGAGVTGLSGMLPVAPLPSNPTIKLLRPLLTTTRAEIEQYCKQHNLAPRQDPSNSNETFFRNKVRHTVLPFLAQYAPNLKQKLAQTAQLARADEAYLQEQTALTFAKLVFSSGRDFVRIDRKKWVDLPLSIQRRTLRRALSNLSSEREVGFQSLEGARAIALTGETNAKAIFSADVTLTVEHQTLLLALNTAILPVEGPQLLNTRSIVLPVPGEIQLANGWVISAELVSSQTAIPSDKWQAVVNVTGDLVVRPRLTGEKIQPFGMDGLSTTLKKVMNGRKIPAPARALWPLVATDQHPVWIVGHIIDHRVRVSAESSGQFIHLTCRST